MPSRAPQQAPPASTEAVYHDDDPPPPYTVLEESETAALLDGRAGGGNGTPVEDYGVARRGAPRRRLLPLSNLMTIFLACILGTFLATCPIPRQSVPQLPRLALMTLCTSLVTLFSPAGGRTTKKPIVARRLIVAYLGLYLAAYALFGLAEEVGFETSSVGAVVFGHRTAAVGLQPGYGARALMVAVGFALQRASGLFSTCRILATYLLLMAWVYADAPLTILSLATGRKHW
ncbi:hypothetical protein PG997_004847 [Apiospora hydei]|uniref:Uncharacterized protein n=1 Tax=Apiospora hydei TaxID=1337664 RepID=A0ABR1X388_9PEZI